MPVCRKVHRFRMRPTRLQEPILNRLAGARRFVWNWALARKREHYKATGKTLPTAALSLELTALKATPETAWLREADSQALQQAVADLARAFANFFERRARHPRFKAKKRLALAHRKARDQRNDLLHKLSTDLVGRHEAIRIEDLNVQGLARTKLAKSFSDAAMGEFRRQLEYKCAWNRRVLIAVDRVLPSSQMCNRRGELNDRLSLSDREWACDCGARHKRDLLAACNIRDEGARMLAAGQAESPKRSGSRCETRATELSASN
jgi:IS605 OrfB family transposase